MFSNASSPELPRTVALHVHRSLSCRLGGRRPDKSMAAILRSAIVEDASDIIRVLRSSRLHFLPYAPPVHSAEEDLEWARLTLIPTGGVTVATVNRIVGVLAVSRANDTNWIDQLYVEPEHCGHGIGSLLMNAALSSLRRPIRLYVFQQNVAAQRFYQKFGFLPVQWRDGSGNEEGCPDVLYELTRD
jgi:ribosomal protein S18 acetylase RimI-like enzyme